MSINTGMEELWSIQTMEYYIVQKMRWNSMTYTGSNGIFYIVKCKNKVIESEV